MREAVFGEPHGDFGVAKRGGKDVALTDRNSSDKMVAIRPVVHKGDNAVFDGHDSESPYGFKQPSCERMVIVHTLGLHRALPVMHDRIDARECPPMGKRLNVVFGLPLIHRLGQKLDVAAFWT